MVAHSSFLSPNFHGPNTERYDELVIKLKYKKSESKRVYTLQRQNKKVIRLYNKLISLRLRMAENTTKDTDDITLKTCGIRRLQVVA